MRMHERKDRGRVSLIPNVRDSKGIRLDREESEQSRWRKKRNSRTTEEFSSMETIFGLTKVASLSLTTL
jgi:hypothetical protein